MKRILLISLLLLAVICTVSADRRRLLGVRNVAGAASCSLHATNTSAQTTSFDALSVPYLGVFNYDPGASVSVCSVFFDCTWGTGDYKATIWTQTGSDLNNKLGTSDTYSASGTRVIREFTFASAVALSSGTSYAIVVSKTDETSSHGGILYCTADGGLSGWTGRWAASKVQDNWNNIDPKIGIWKQ